VIDWIKDKKYENTWMNEARTVAKCPGQNGERRVVATDYSKAQVVSFYRVVVSAAERVKLLEDQEELRADIWNEGFPYCEEIELLGKGGCELVAIDTELILEVAEEITGQKLVGEGGEWHKYTCADNVSELLEDSRNELEHCLVFFVTDQPILITTFEPESLDFQNYLISPRIYEGDCL